MLSERTRACVMGVECENGVGVVVWGQGGGISPGTVASSYYCSYYYKYSVKISTPVNSLHYKEFKNEYMGESTARNG